MLKRLNVGLVNSPPDHIDVYLLDAYLLDAYLLDAYLLDAMFFLRTVSNLPTTYGVVAQVILQTGMFLASVVHIV